MRVIQSVVFLEDGSALVTFMDPDVDVRNRQRLVQTHQMVVSPEGMEYRDEIEDVRDAARRLLDDAMEDWVTTTDAGVQQDEAPDALEDLSVYDDDE